MTVHSTLDIKLLGKEYRVSCAPEERESLEAAVRFLSDKMDDIAEKTRSTGERLAVMVALNLAHELLAQAGGSPPADAVDGAESRRRIAAIEARLDAVLAEQTQEDLF